MPPTKTPNAILQARGSRWADSNPNEPIPDSLPSDFTPTFLTEEEKETWDDIAPQLINLRVMTTLDWRMLERYCVIYHRWKKQIRCKYAKTAELDQMAKQLMAIEGQLGMSPAARRSIKSNPTKPKEKKDDIAKYFKVS